MVIYVAGEDFGPSQWYLVTFYHGSLRQSVNIPIIDDNVYEFDETFLLQIFHFEHGIIGGRDTRFPNVTVVCTDDDCKFFRYTCLKNK